MKLQILLTALGVLAFPACAAPLAYEPFDYTPGELLAPRTTNSWYWIAQASGANDAAIVPGNLTVEGLMTSSGNCFTNGGAGQGNRFVLMNTGTSLTNGTVYASYAMRIDNLGASFIGTGQANPPFVTAICFSNVLGTLIQYCCLLVNTNDVYRTNYFLGIRQGSGVAIDTWVTTPYPVGKTLFVVQGYTFVDGEGNDVCDIWIDPAPSTFGAASPPTATVTAFQPSGFTDAYWIDRINFRQAAAASIPQAMTFDELRVGTNWADVTPPPPPQLKIAAGAPNAVLSWPTNFSGFVLQDNTNLASTDWSVVTNDVVVDGTNNTVTVELTPAERFFRLLK